MKKRKKRFRTLAAVAGILLVLVLLTAGNGYVYDLVTGSVLTPLMQTAAQLGNSFAPQKSMEELKQENNRLQAENNRLNDLLADYDDIKEANQELSKFFDIKQEHQDFVLATASVIARDPNENFGGFTLDRGSVDGIAPNMPVLTEKGLVGWVNSVNVHTCKVTTLLSPEAGIAAADKACKENGVITGSAALADSGLTCLTNIRQSSKIAVNDILVTAGSGVYPANVKIGAVRYLTVDSYTGMPMAVVEPFEDAQEVSSVVIVKRFTGEKQ